MQKVREEHEQRRRGERDHEFFFTKKWNRILGPILVIFHPLSWRREYVLNSRDILLQNIHQNHHLFHSRLHVYIPGAKYLTESLTFKSSTVILPANGNSFSSLPHLASSNMNVYISVSGLESLADGPIKTALGYFTTLISDI